MHAIASRRLIFAFAALALLVASLAPDRSQSAETTPRGSLAGQLLIATPAMRDPRFDRAVILMLRHDQDGAFGIVINRPLGQRPLAELLQAPGAKDTTVSGNVQVFNGGPVQPNVGFVVHSTDYHRAETLDVGGRVSMTSSREVLRDIADKKGPAKALIAFGYAGWAPGQLEAELARNVWHTAPEDRNSCSMTTATRCGARHGLPHSRPVTGRRCRYAAGAERNVWKPATAIKRVTPRGRKDRSFDPRNLAAFCWVEAMLPWTARAMLIKLAGVVSRCRSAERYCGNAASDMREIDHEQKTGLGDDGSFQGLAELVAYDEGLFEKEGIVVEWADREKDVDKYAQLNVTSHKGVNPFSSHGKLLEQGKADLYNACEWGNYSRVEGTKVGSRQIGRRSIVTFAALVVRSDSPVQTPQQFADWQIGVLLFGTTI
jgi:putative AlgH/UPF0301 family transcriptional regulator